jgi:P27 family predicted phage terminase small subunit
MPRTKKPAGTAVDRRNGRRTEIAAAESLRRFGLPRRDAPVVICEDCGNVHEQPQWDPETKKAWAAMWKDPVSSLLSPADRPILLRWADAIDRAVRALRLADADPVAKGSQGQPVENPLYGVADKALRVAQACEAQIGIGALNRARLGLTFTQAQLSLQDLNAALDGGGNDDDDPRVG